MAQGDAAESRASQQNRRRLNAPIVRKKTMRYQAPSAIPGIRHMIEGAPSRTVRSVSYNPEASLGLSPNETFGRDLGTVLFNRKERKAWETDVADFRRKQELRKNIVSLPDPDDLSERSRRQRQSARRRRRGRLGTILTSSPGTNEGLG